MKWQNNRRSSNVDDVRSTTGRSPMGGRGGGGGLFKIVAVLFRMFGVKGVAIALIGGFALWKMGILDPSMLTGGAPAQSSAPKTQAETEYENRMVEFVSVVLGDTEEIWQREFAEIGRTYEPPTLVVYRGFVRTGCGGGSAAMGPFYCPADQKIYIDLGFYEELEEVFQAPGDFAQAYVLAHEVGHHVQKLLGFSDKVNARRGKPDYKQMSVRLELQADFFAGIWANNSKIAREDGDVEEAIRAANAIGDDAIQKRTQGRVVPHAFTHGTSEQRTRWFLKGLRSGDLKDGDTFSPAYEGL